MKPISISELLTWDPQLIEIEKSANQLPWSVENLRSCFAEGYQNFVAYDEVNHELLGFILIHQPIADEWTIMNVVVAAQSQRQGVGQQLVQHVCHLAQLNNADLFLEVRASNQPAIALYGKLGFNTLGKRKGYYPTASGDREDAIIMKKSQIKTG
jgi:ribosomal-protein-alanine N-acetyltransferase